jgi:hypothetical protein
LCISHSVNRFTENRNIKRISPKKNKLLQWRLPVTVSLISIAIFAVIGLAESNGVCGGSRVLPATISTITVSPIILLKFIRNAAIIPFDALGSITFQSVCSSSAPSARLESL